VSDLLLSDKSKTVNNMLIEAPIEKVWQYFSTADGWNRYLSDIAQNYADRNEITQGDMIQFVIGELTNYSTCVDCKKPHYISFRDTYEALFPNGENWTYELKTSFLLEQKGGMTEVTVLVEGYTEDEMMQWVRECGEMGWRQSLFNLKCVIELGLDLRNEIFNYPRLGVFNYSATEEQIRRQGLNPARVKGNYLHTVYPNGPAARAGLQNGDIITHINQYAVPSYYQFVRALSRHYRIKADVAIQYYRSGKPFRTTAVLTLDDQFTGMIDPLQITLEELALQRRQKQALSDDRRIPET
jgi:uncharacterized protein YndB with AHSA1/START domain